MHRARLVIMGLAVFGLLISPHGCADQAEAPFVCVYDGLEVAAATVCDGTTNCSDGSDEAGCPALAEDGGDGNFVAAPPTPADPKVHVPETCAFNPEMEGRQVGQHVANFTVSDHEDDTWALHSLCGSGKQAIWIVLAAQW